jgi:AcrR family transcriptional regulator
MCPARRIAAAGREIPTIASVRDRLDGALEQCLSTLTADGLAEITVDLVGQLASVSRATAYRYFGDRDGMFFRATTLLTWRHAERTRALVAPLPTVAAKVEECFAYTAREIRCDRLMFVLLTSPRSDGIESVLKAIALDLLGPSLEYGQTDGQVRDDVAVDELIDWLQEQSHAIIRLGLDEEDARQWVRRFVLPSLRPDRADMQTPAELRHVLEDVSRQVTGLKRLIDRAQGVLD